MTSHVEFDQIIKTPNVTAAFVNSHQDPIKINRTGHFDYTQEFKNRNIDVWELCELVYPHPSSEEITISVFRWLRVEHNEPSTTLIKNVIDAAKDLRHALIGELYDYPNK